MMWARIAVAEPSDDFLRKLDESNKFVTEIILNGQKRQVILASSEVFKDLDSTQLGIEKTIHGRILSAKDDVNLNSEKLKLFEDENRRNDYIALSIVRETNGLLLISGSKDGSNGQSELLGTFDSTTGLITVDEFPTTKQDANSEKFETSEHNHNSCPVGDLFTQPTEPLPPNRLLVPRNPVPLVYQVALVLDNEFVTEFGSVQNAQTNVANIMNGIALNYQRDLNVQVVVTHSHFWVPPSMSLPNPTGSPGVTYTHGFDNFETYNGSSNVTDAMALLFRFSPFVALTPGTEPAADTMHLISGRRVNFVQGVYNPIWGLANVLCSGRSLDASVSGLNARINTSSHELGHNIGLLHASDQYYSVPGSSSSRREIMYTNGTTTSNVGFGPASVDRFNTATQNGGNSCLKSLNPPPRIQSFSPQAPASGPNWITREEGSTVTFSIDVVSAEPPQIQWYVVGQGVPRQYFSQNTTTFTTPPLPLAYSGATWGAYITNAAGTISSPTLTIAVVPRTTPICVADADGDGLVQTGDIFYFLNLFFKMSNAADFDQSGVVTTQDIFEYLNAFFASPPECMGSAQ